MNTMWFLWDRSFNDHCCISQLRSDFQYFGHLLPLAGDGPEEPMELGDQFLFRHPRDVFQTPRLNCVKYFSREIHSFCCDTLILVPQKAYQSLCTDQNGNQSRHGKYHHSICREVIQVHLQSNGTSLYYMQLFCSQRGDLVHKQHLVTKASLPQA